MNLRQAAQQALEALEHEARTGNDDAYRAEREALRAALAEPEQEAISLNNGRLTQYPDGSIGVGTPAEPEQEPQTTHWEGCEAVHPECKTEHEVKDLSNYEFKTYKTGGAELEAGFYSTDELRDLVKALDKMNAATERHMRRMK